MLFQKNLLVDSSEQERTLFLKGHHGRRTKPDRDKGDETDQQTRPQGQRAHSLGSRSAYPTPRTVCSNGGPTASIFLPIGSILGLRIRRNPARHEIIHTNLRSFPEINPKPSSEGGLYLVFVVLSR